MAPPALAASTAGSTSRAIGIPSCSARTVTGSAPRGGCEMRIGPHAHHRKSAKPVGTCLSRVGVMPGHARPAAAPRFTEKIASQLVSCETDWASRPVLIQLPVEPGTRRGALFFPSRGHEVSGLQFTNQAMQPPVSDLNTTGKSLNERVHELRASDLIERRRGS